MSRSEPADEFKFLTAASDAVWRYLISKREGDSRVKHVLVVDDSHVIRRLVEVVLGQIQLDVRTAASGGEAIVSMEDRTPDLVVLDVGLPDMTGWDVLTHVRETSALRGSAVIILTGRSDADDIDQAEELGADAYLTKPFRPDELRRVVVDTIRGGERATA